MCDIGVIDAMLRNNAVQELLRSMMVDNSAIMLTKAINTAASDSLRLQGSDSKHSLVSVILSWLLDNIETGFLGFFGTLRSLVNYTLNKSTKNESMGSSSDSGQVIHLTMFLSIINLLIVFVRRVLKHKLML